mmetsp:Transcript_10452/g.29064  ORF Transcript_10452/g.29064 Transcript_10452/m.29064 type:complete len:276 (+) Transcript_10452:334-1161(+)
MWRLCVHLCLRGDRLWQDIHTPGRGAQRRSPGPRAPCAAAPGGGPGGWARAPLDGRGLLRADPRPPHERPRRCQRAAAQLAVLAPGRAGPDGAGLREVRGRHLRRGRGAAGPRLRGPRGGRHALQRALLAVPCCALRDVPEHGGHYPGKRRSARAGGPRGQRERAKERCRRGQQAACGGQGHQQEPQCSCGRRGGHLQAPAVRAVPELAAHDAAGGGPHAGQGPRHGAREPPGPGCHGLGPLPQLCRPRAGGGLRRAAHAGRAGGAAEVGLAAPP